MVHTVPHAPGYSPRSPPPMAPSALPVVYTTDKLDPLPAELNAGSQGGEDGHPDKHADGERKAKVPRAVITEWVGGANPCVIA